MFWRWFEPWGFMETEPGSHLSQHDSLSQRLFYKTFWGDYGGDIYSRYLYTDILERAGGSVSSVDALHGQGLVLSSFGTTSADIRYILEILAIVDEYGYLEDGFSEWEYELTEKELQSGWTGQEMVRNWEREWDRMVDGWEFPVEQGDDTFNAILSKFLYNDDGEYPYWETADSLILPTFAGDREVVLFIIGLLIAPSLTQGTELF